MVVQTLTKDVPSGFAGVKLDKVIRADKEIWTILAQQQSKSLKPVNDVPVLNKDFVIFNRSKGHHVCPALACENTGTTSSSPSQT